MSDSHLIDRLAGLDAFPDSAPLPEEWFDFSLDPHLQRSTVLTTLHEMERVEPKKSGRYWRPLAALAVIVVAMAAFVAQNDSGPDSAGTPTTAISTTTLAPTAAPDEAVGEPTTVTAPTTTVTLESVEPQQLAIAEAIKDAFYSFDEVSLLAATGTGLAGEDDLLQNQRSSAELNSAILEDFGCSVFNSATVRCVVRATGDLSKAWGFDGVEEVIQVSFNGTKILRVSMESKFPEYTYDYFQWLETNYDPEDQACPDGGRGYDDCWERILLYIPEFIASDSYTGP